MQSPYSAQNMAPQASLPRRKSPLKKAALIGGGGLLGLLVLGTLLGDSKGSNGSRAAQTDAHEVAYSSPAFQKYLGKWTGSDGTSLWIRGDGKGDFDGGSLKVSGGGMTLDEDARTLAISSFLGMGRSWKITTPSDGSRMALDGITFRRSDNAGASSASPSTSGASGGEAMAGQAPSKPEQQRLVKETLAQFDGALGSGDFSGLCSYSSRAWQAETSASQFKSSFQGFLDQKIRLNQVLAKNPMVLTGEPEFADNGVMTVRGHYPAGPKRLSFDLGYLPEEGAWKLAALNVQVKKAP